MLIRRGPRGTAITLTYVLNAVDRSLAYGAVEAFDVSIEACSAMTRRAVRPDEHSGRDDRSDIPSWQKARYRTAHFFADAAADAGEQLTLTAGTGSILVHNAVSQQQRPLGCKTTLRWDTRTSQ
jgi:hypothetical protein